MVTFTSILPGFGWCCQPCHSTDTTSPNRRKVSSASFNPPARKQISSARSVPSSISTPSSILTVASDSQRPHLVTNPPQTMRLLECSDGKFKLTKDLVHDIPKYAILPHTWGPDTDEVTFRDLVDGTGETRLATRRSGSAQNRRDAMASNISGWIPAASTNRTTNHTRQ